MSEHTKGPWTINPRVSTNVVDLNGRGICSTGGYSTNLIPQDLLTEQNDANARLIAAAPDLLAALKEMVADHERWLADGCIATLPGTMSRAAIDAARAAIALAEGKP